MAFTRAPLSAVITDATGNTINLGNASGAFTAAPVSIVLTDANGKTLNVGPGVVAKYDATAQAANIGSTTLYAVPASAAGRYRVSAQILITQAATTSSTLPSFQYGWTDNDTGLAQGNTLTNTYTGNTAGNGNHNIGLQTSETTVFNVRGGTTITLSTSGYASSGATPMQYALHVTLEYLGA